MTGNNKAGVPAAGLGHIEGGISKAGVVGLGATAVADARIQALEQRVAMLEELIGNLSSVLVVSHAGHKVFLRADTIELDAAVELKIKGGLQVQVHAGTDLTLKSGNTAKLEGSGSLELKSAGSTKVKGSTLSLNDGTRFVARQADPVLGLGGAGAIAGGNPTILA